MALEGKQRESDEARERLRAQSYAQQPPPAPMSNASNPAFFAGTMQGTTSIAEALSQQATMLTEAHSKQIDALMAQQHKQTEAQSKQVEALTEALAHAHVQTNTHTGEQVRVYASTLQQQSEQAVAERSELIQTLTATFVSQQASATLSPPRLRSLPRAQPSVTRAHGVVQSGDQREPQRSRRQAAAKRAAQQQASAAVATAKRAGQPARTAFYF